MSDCRWVTLHPLKWDSLFMKKSSRLCGWFTSVSLAGQCFWISFCRMNLEVIRCPFYFQNSAFQTCLALQALTARPDEVMYCDLVLSLYRWRKLPPWKCPLLGSVRYSLVRPLLGSAPYSEVPFTWKWPLLWNAPYFRLQGTVLSGCD